MTKDEFCSNYRKVLDKQRSAWKAARLKKFILFYETLKQRSVDGWTKVCDLRYECNISPRTVRRWTYDLEAAGVVKLRRIAERNAIEARFL